MGWFGDDHETAKAHEQDTSTPHEHKAKLSHELISGAATYEAAKAYEEHSKKHGKPTSHEKAKEVFAGFSGVAVDRFVETKGLDFINKDKGKAKR